jgi:hypothetical protein
LNGSPWNGQVNKYWLAAADGTATFVGDLVKLSGTADVDGNPSIAQCAAGNTPIGPIVWFEPNPADLTQNYRPASQNLANQNAGRWAYVADSPDLIVEMQEDAVGGALAITSVGQNVDVIVGAGSTTTGQSGMQADSSTANTTSTLVMRIIGFRQSPDNEIGNANSKVLLAFNVHQYGSVGTTGV